MAKERPVDPDCKDPVDPTACLVQSPVPFRRLEDPCGNVILPDPCTIDPTKFSAAEAVVAAAPAPLVPLLSVQLGNTEVTRSCTDLPDSGTGVTGVPVTIAGNALTAGVPLFEIDGLTEAQRSALAGLSQPTVNGFAGQTALQIAELTTMTLAQAEAFKARITADQATLQAEAVLLALAGLECYYLNAAQTVTCAPDENAVAADAGTTTVTVAAGAVRSTLSLAAANLDAQSLGLSQLECRWFNTVQTALCATPGAVNYSHTVAAATLTSPTSRVDADTQALALASGFLDCRYANAAQTATCVGSAIEQSGANPITVAAGTIFSAINAEDATAQALAVAQASLTCRWENTERVKTCPQDTGHEASPTASPVRQATVPAGTFSSTLSQADANEQADLFATAQLDCRYCNTLVEALCVTGGSYDQTAAVLAGTFCESTYAAAQQLATALAAIPVQVQVTGTPTCHFTNDRVVAGCAAGTGITAVKFAGAAAAGLSASSSGSITVDAGAITSTVSKADANTQARALALASLNCFFDSAEKEFKCAGTGHSTNATQPFTVAAAMFRSYTSLTEANAQRDSYGSSQLDCFWDSDASAPIKCAADASAQAYPQFEAPVTLPVGFFSSYTSKAEANALRDSYAASILNCFWDSDVSGEIKCAADASAQAYPQFEAPVTLPVGFFSSYTSKAEANSLRDSYAASILNCFWDSDASAPIKCAADASTKAYPQFAAPVTLQAGFFTSYTSKAEANSLRDSYAASILNCFWDSDASAPIKCAADASTKAYPQFGTPVTIPAAFFSSYTSKAEANSLRDSYAASILNCFWDSDASAPIKCAADASTKAYPQFSAPVTLHAGFFTSYTSKAEANALRDVYAASILSCFWDSAASAPLKCSADASAQAYPQFAAPVTLPVGFFTSYNSQAEANSLRDSYAASILNCFWDSDASGAIKCPADAASGSYPAFGTPVTVPAAFFTSYTSKAEANTLRDLYAASILVCFWRNAAQQSWCDGSAATEAQAPKSVTIAADTIVSFVSKTDANNLALSLATASLTCIYANAAQTGDACAGGTTQMQTGAVAAGTIMASSKAAANALAKTLANALNVCVADSIFLSAGSAGAQGPSGNCSTNCGAYYS